MSDLKKPCASCPFIKGNYEEFNTVVNRLRAAIGAEPLDFFQCITARERVIEEAFATWRFACHASVYNGAMEQTGDPVACAGFEEAKKVWGYVGGEHSAKKRNG